jgi:exodeoxyribonuclease VII large subunit
MNGNPLLASLFDEDERRPWSVSELNREVGAVLERSFGSVWVEGEITNFHAHGSGHWYFSLTDGEAFIKAACFKNQNFRIRFTPSDGLLVRIRGKVSVYGSRGDLQIVVESLEPVGEGALAVAFEQIKAKLLKEGLFDEALKRPLPTFPRRIGIVTSPSGAALHDIVTVLERRARSISIVLIPAQVQGERAGEQIASAIALANRYCDTCLEHERIDVLIVGRGGGSAEDLWAFNEERVARSIRASNIPVISAVGHEVDFTIADMAADFRAATPSAAAEIVAKAEADIYARIDQRYADLTRSMSYMLLRARTDLQSLAMAPVFAEFPAYLRRLRYELDDLTARAHSSITSRLKNRDFRLTQAATRLSPVGLASKLGENRKRLAVLDQRNVATATHLTETRHRELERVTARLDVLSPLSVLKRGYSITQNADGEIIRDAHQTHVGERLNIRVARGEIEAEVKELSTEGDLA